MDDETLSIREAGRRTGVNPVTLRAWERRYGLLKPARTESGHRLYGARDLHRINDIVFWVERGVPISKVRDLLARDTGSDEDADGVWHEWLEKAHQALEAGNSRRLEKLAGELLSLYPLETVARQWIDPVRVSLRERGVDPVTRGRLVLFETTLRQKLGVRLLNMAPTKRSGGVLLAPVGPQNELDLLMLALTVGSATPLWFSPEYSDSEASLALAGDIGARATVLSISPSLSATALRRLLGSGARRLDVPVFAVSPAGAPPVRLPAGLQWLSGSREELARELSRRLEVER